MEDILVKLLGVVIQRFGLISYADDTQLSLALSNDPLEMVETLNSCLGAVLEWMRANKLKFNSDKMEMLLVEKRSEPGFNVVISKLDYCNVFCMEVPLRSVQTLQLIQTTASTMLIGEGHWDQITPVLAHIPLLTICFQAQFKGLALTFKALYSLQTTNLKDC